MRKIKVSHSELLEAVEGIGRLAKLAYNPDNCSPTFPYKADVVVAVERGGVPLGLYLSEILEVPLKTIRVSCYKGDVRRLEPDVDLNGFNIDDYKFPIFCDDLIDSGTTRRYIHTKFDLFPFIALYVLQGEGTHIFHGKKEKDDWLEFPWELENDKSDERYFKPKWWKNIK